jgi:hypothetical protein
MSVEASFIRKDGEKARENMGNVNKHSLSKLT